MSGSRRYRVELVDDGDGDPDMRLTDALALLRRRGFRVLDVQTRHMPTRAAKERLAKLIDGEEWDISIARHLEGVWLMDREQVSGILFRCVVDPPTREEFLRLTEEWSLTEPPRLALVEASEH